MFSKRRSLYGLNFAIMPSTDGAFTGANTVDIVDNYFVYNRPNSQQWGSSNALSPISVGTSFSSKDGSPDNLVAFSWADAGIIASTGRKVVRINPAAQAGTRSVPVYLQLARWVTA